MASLFLRGLRHTQSKEEEEVTRGLLGVVQLPRLSPQSLPCCLCWIFPLSHCTDPPAALGTQGKPLNSRAALQEQQGGVFTARGITVHCAHLQDCGFTLFLLIPRGHTPQQTIPTRVPVLTAENHSWPKHSFRQKGAAS